MMLHNLVYHVGGMSIWRVGGGVSETGTFETRGETRVRHGVFGVDRGLWRGRAWLHFSGCCLTFKGVLSPSCLTHVLSIFCLISVLSHLSHTLRDIMLGIMYEVSLYPTTHLFYTWFPEIGETSETRLSVAPRHTLPRPVSNRATA